MPTISENLEKWADSAPWSDGGDNVRDRNFMREARHATTAAGSA